MKLTEALKKLVGLTEQVNAKLDKISPQPPKAEDNDGDDDDECPDCDGSGKCASCEGSGKMEGRSKATTHTHAVAAATQALTDANAKIDAHVATIAAKDATIADLNKKLEAANTQVGTLGTQNTTLKADLEKEKTKTASSIAAAGVKGENLPEAAANPATKTNAWEKYVAFMEQDPAMGGRYYAENKVEILKAREELINKPKTK